MGEVYNDLPCTIEDVVGLIGIQVIRNTNTQMHCRCPFCNDRKAHLNVRKDKDVSAAIGAARVAACSTYMRSSMRSP